MKAGRVPCVPVFEVCKMVTGAKKVKAKKKFGGGINP